MPLRTEASRARFTSHRIALLVAPPVLLAGMYLAYRGFALLFGPKGGYLAGFLLYWAFWCLLFPLWALGPRGLREVLRDVRPRLGRPAWLGLLLLAIPPILGFSTAFPRALSAATGNLGLIVPLSALIALVNATLEELLWRGAYVTAFPKSVWLGYLYPALGFALWHLAPLSVRPSTMPGGAASFIVGAFVLGLYWGWVAWRTGSIRWTVISHMLLDLSGLGALKYFG